MNLAPTLVAVALSASALAQDITTTFNATAEGWTAVDCNCGGNYAPVLNANPTAWQAAPGYGGANGFLQTNDPFGNCIFFSAPSTYLGDRSSYLNGRLEFALRTNVTDWPNDDVVVLVSSGAPVLVKAAGLPNPVNTWVHFTVPLKASAGWRVGSKTGAAATQAQLSAALATLTAVRVPAEFGSTNPEEIVGLDNVRLSRACSAADVGSQGGIAGPDHILDNNDFIVFIDYFFAGNPLADLGRQGGIPPGDGAFDNNDFIVFIDLFFEGCV